MKEGAKTAREAIQNPKDGTILDVIDAAAQSLEKKQSKKTILLIFLKRQFKKQKKP